MRVLQLDPFAGAAGDMFFGALVDLGVSLAEVEQGLRTMPIGGWKLSSEKVRRGGIQATKVRVHLDALGGGEEGYLTAHAHRHGHEAHDGHDHKHHHDAGRSATHGHGNSDPHLADHGRKPSEIMAIIRASKLPGPVIVRACEVFHVLALAEARVHGMTPETVHFHEVGAVDAIVDIAASVFALWLLGVERVHATTATTGHGVAHCAHGMVPVPAPATLFIMEGLPVRPGPIEAELLTPTGASLLRVLVTEWRPVPAYRVLGCGFGAGNSDWPELPNVLRATLGETVLRAGAPVTVEEAEFEVDDMRPEGLGYLRERLELAGALDVSITAVQMKKNRPGHHVAVLFPREQAAGVEDAIFRHSSTFGFRLRTTERRILDREIIAVSTPLGLCRVKIGRLNGEMIRARPEYEDVAALARATGLPVDDVEALVLEHWRRTKTP